MPGPSAEKYKAIIDAGFVLQIDTPVAKFSALDLDVSDLLERLGLLVEVLNETLEGLPEDRIRLHVCYGGGRGAHSEDAELPDFIDLLLQVKAQGLSYDQNPRHEWEWKIWKDRKLPDGKVLIPGCVSHTNDVIEHPELVRQRIVRLANLVGRENVIASTDCGLAQSVFAPKIHPDLVGRVQDVGRGRTARNEGAVEELSVSPQTTQSAEAESERGLDHGRGKRADRGVTQNRSTGGFHLHDPGESTTSHGLRRIRHATRSRRQPSHLRVGDTFTMRMHRLGDDYRMVNVRGGVRP